VTDDDHDPNMSLLNVSTPMMIPVNYFDVLVHGLHVALHRCAVASLGIFYA